MPVVAGRLRPRCSSFAGIRHRQTSLDGIQIPFKTVSRSDASAHPCKKHANYEGCARLGLWGATNGRNPRHVRLAHRGICRSAVAGAGACEDGVAVLVAACDEDGLQAALAAARELCPCRVVGILAGSDGHGLTTAQELKLESFLPQEEVWQLKGTLEDAVTCALDPSRGMLTCMGLVPALCLVGICREPSLGEDQDHSRSIAAAKRASVIGKPANCPRAHFPFPSEGRWSSLGGPQLPGTDPELTRSLGATSSSLADFAASDCWSFGNNIPLDSTASVNKANTAEELRDVLRSAFREGDVFLAVHVPPRWGAGQARFSSTRPGQTQASSNGAVFVPQLNTMKVVRDTRVVSKSVGGQNGEEMQVPVSLPTSFTIGSGTSLMDASSRGDVDAVFAGVTSVTTMQTWSHSHAFSLLDGVMVEALREDSVSGLPAWLLSKAQ
eukprot:gene14644-20680_t